MKQIKNILAITILSVCGISCNDILDKGPLDKYSENDIWSNTDLTQAFIYTTLSKSAEMLITKDQWTDNSMIQEDLDATNINKEQIDRYHDAGWNKYEDIRRCNMILTKVEESDNFLPKEKSYFIAQAKMMRAMIYFSRARLFGKLMIVDRIIDPNEDMTFPRTKTIKETYDFIIKDLKEAIPDLPEKLNNQQGMLTKGAGYALLSEVALHGASYIESGQDEYYKIAKQSCEDLFALGLYELDEDYENMFNNFNHALSSKEIILAHWRHEDNTKFQDTWMQGLGLCTNNDKIIPEATPKFQDDFLSWPLSFPSVDLVNAYQVIDEDGTAKNWDETSYYKDFAKNGGYVSNAIYKNRDKRFYATVVQDSAKFFNSTITTRDKGNAHWNSNIYGNWGQTKTGYVYRKCMYETKRVYCEDPTCYHYVLLRLGRSYLNYAEVLLRQGNVSTAIEYINKTRVTHGGLPALKTNLSLTDAWKEYKRERRLELTMEGDRYWSLLRWGKAEKQEIVKELTIPQQAISISADGRSFEFIPIQFYVGENIRNFTSKRYLMPVPQKERDMNPSLDQNPGW